MDQAVLGIASAIITIISVVWSIIDNYQYQQKMNVKVVSEEQEIFNSVHELYRKELDKKSKDEVVYENYPQPRAIELISESTPNEVREMMVVDYISDDRPDTSWISHDHIKY